LVQTPVITEKENLKVKTSKIDVSGTGTAHIDMRASFYNNWFSEFLGLYLRTERERQDYANKELFSMPLNIIEIETINTSDKSPGGQINIRAEAPSCGTKVGNYLLLDPFLFINLPGFNLAQKTRQQDFYVPYGYSLVDTLHYQLSPQAIVDELPANSNVESCIGQYAVQYIKTGTQVACVSSFIWFGGTHPKENEEEIVNFFSQINNIKKQRVIINAN
ncbi:MAG: hypothetical protein HC896_11685, partial [Bacteroidales bacterium]|nr:hypothetical protein [Bacteroidales bacterium]